MALTKREFEKYVDKINEILDDMQDSHNDLINDLAAKEDEILTLNRDIEDLQSEVRRLESEL